MRECSNCKSTNTKKWIGSLCRKCYDKLIHHPLSSKKDNPRRIKFKDKRIHVKEIARNGICSFCGAVKGVDCKKTQLHHFKYHDDDPLKDTIELCVSCHNKQHDKLGKILV